MGPEPAAGMADGLAETGLEQSASRESATGMEQASTVALTAFTIMAQITAKK